MLRPHLSHSHVRGSLYHWELQLVYADTFRRFIKLSKIEAKLTEELKTKTKVEADQGQGRDAQQRQAQYVLRLPLIAMSGDPLTTRNSDLSKKAGYGWK